jgi:arylsulfatase A-like enzyme
MASGTVTLIAMKTVVLTVVAACALLVIPHASGKQASAARPNVLLIITDDQGYGDFSAHGNPHLKTPNLDQLGAESIQFDRFFVSPVCAPTRAALLTGRDALRTGVWGVTGGRETIRGDEVTVADALRDAGYRTGLIGKWHNGAHYPFSPQGRGFDEFFGFTHGHWNDYFDTELERNGKRVKTRGYITDIFTDEAIRFIEQNRRRPFFLMLSYNVPHTPYQVPDRYFEHFKAMGLDDGLACIYGMCANLDENVGRLLKRLDQLALGENTVVIFLTDNGANGARFNAGMRGYKGSIHEGGVRVPLFVRWPARFKTPHRVEQIAAHVDLFPTILELCNAPHPKTLPLDGRSLVPLLDGTAADWPERILFTHRVRGANPPALMSGAARNQRYRLVADGKDYQLYDMVSDPGQQKDIAGANPEIVQQLSHAYEGWFEDVTQNGFARIPIPVGHPEQRLVELPASEAILRGGVRFFGGNGYAHDWITRWTSTHATVSWPIEVVRSGRYEVALGYLCPRESAGSTIRVTVGDTALETILRGTPIKEIPLPHRARSSNPYVNREWHSVKLGRVHLPASTTTVTVEALNVSGTQVMDLKYVSLRRLD